MDAFWTEIFEFPTGVFTVFLGISLLYWIVFLFGAVDLDALGGAEGGLDGALDGGLDGALDGGLDGALDGGLDGALDGGLDSADGAIEGAGEAGAGFLGFLRLRSVPITVSFSFFSLFGWMLSYFSMSLLSPELSPGLAMTVAGAAGLFGGLGLTSLGIRPLAPIFADNPGRSHADLIGEVVVLTTGRVDGKFGQGMCLMDGVEILVDIRNPDTNALKRGDKAVIIDHDETHHTFVVEPADALLMR
ncbi:MAG: hypothetical protein ACI9MR_002159 [Myxococcota bacterium]|jgi:hypothetical protein